MSELRRDFLTSIVHAGGAAAVGDKKLMENYLKEAKKLHLIHIKDYAKTNCPEEVEAENTRCTDYFSKIHAIFDGSFRSKGKKAS